MRYARICVNGPYLISGDAVCKGFTHTVARQYSNNHISKPRLHRYKQAEDSNLQRGRCISVDSVVCFDEYVSLIFLLGLNVGAQLCRESGGIEPA